MIAKSDLKDNTTDNVELSSINHDTNGAVIYIIIVILWYSIGIVFLLAMDILVRSEEMEDSTRDRDRFVIQNLRDYTNTREILEELADKQTRDRLWDIYLGTTCDRKNYLTRAETLRIRHIEKQLATIKRDHRRTYDTHCYMRSLSDYRPATSQISSKPASTIQRQSSLDQQTLERWKSLTNLSKPYEQFPWAIRKLTVRKYFRRSAKKSSLLEPKHSSPTTDNEETNLISSCNQYRKLVRGRTEIDLCTITSTINERQNPYISYFYIPPTHSENFTLEFFPAE